METVIMIMGGASIFVALAIIGYCMIDIDDMTRPRSELNQS